MRKIFLFAVLAAAFVAVDGMSYVMSRISMNDIFVATFIVAAYALFWQVWSGRWARSAWWAVAAAVIVLVTSVQAYAEKADREKPIHLESDRVTVDEAKQLALFEGNVVLTQGTLTIRGDRVT